MYVENFVGSLKQNNSRIDQEGKRGTILFKKISKCGTIEC